MIEVRSKAELLEAARASDPRVAGVTRATFAGGRPQAVAWDARGRELARAPWTRRGVAELLAALSAGRGEPAERDGG